MQWKLSIFCNFRSLKCLLTLCEYQINIKLFLPNTPKNASPDTVPASFDRMQVYEPESLSCTFEIKRLPFSCICRRLEGCIVTESERVGKKC